VKRPDKFTNFAALLAESTEGKDFTRTIESRNGAKVVLLAPHGGRIEPCTAEIASEIAGDTFSLYCFLSLRSCDDLNLHITSHKFDDPQCIQLIQAHPHAVAIHGCTGEQAAVFIGGRDDALKMDLAAALSAAGVKAQLKGHPYPGLEPKNICNRTATNAGAQFELTMPFRRGSQRTDFVAAVRSVLMARQCAA
jgi:phage replication-related protein YjqB (UPF0714/DUF867 family)